jgi:ABC-type polysaccharide/polyol phosphate transport system ATPase subunit
VQSTYFIPFNAFIVAIALYWGISILLELLIKRLSQYGKKRNDPCLNKVRLALRICPSSLITLKCLRDINLTVEKGTVVSILGSSGSGNRPCCAA